MTRTRMAPARAAALCALCLPAFGMMFAAAGDAASDEELAQRTYANAQQLMREGKAEQGLRDFEQIAAAYSTSTLADDALFRIGEYYYPIDGVVALGGVPADRLQKARDYFTRIRTKYPRENSAPEALVKLGLIAMDISNPARDLDEAYANFSGVVNIYPESPVVDRALFGAGYADYLTGRYDKAVGMLERTAEEFSDGPAAEAARYYMGMAYERQGLHLRALEEFQTLRDAYPAGRLRERALDRLTQIYKTKIQAAQGVSPLFVYDQSFIPALDSQTLREALVALDPNGLIHVLDLKSGTVIRLGHDGKPLAKSVPLQELVWISVSDAGAEVLASPQRVKSGAATLVPAVQEGNALRPLEKIGAAVQTELNQIALLDEGRNQVLLYSTDPARPRVLFKDASGRARLSGLAAGALGKLYTIEKRDRVIIEISPDATSRRIVPQGAAAQMMQEPVAVAADDLGTLYVLDRRAGAVLVLTVEGKLVDTITSRPGTAGEFSSPSAIAAGPQAEVYIYDSRRRTLIRFH